MSDQVAAAGQQVFELFAACAAAPDDESVGQAADEALRRLEKLLLAQVREETPDQAIVSCESVRTATLT
jgi:3'-phosphoadenosine 5'-phosphosulfate (PAPS) 3'-phosphatase